MVAPVWLFYTGGSLSCETLVFRGFRRGCVGQLCPPAPVPHRFLAVVPDYFSVMATVPTATPLRPRGYALSFHTTAG